MTETYSEPITQSDLQEVELSCTNSSENGYKNDEPSNLTAEGEPNPTASVNQQQKQDSDEEDINSNISSQDLSSCKEDLKIPTLNPPADIQQLTCLENSEDSNNLLKINDEIVETSPLGLRKDNSSLVEAEIQTSATVDKSDDSALQERLSVVEKKLEDLHSSFNDRVNQIGEQVDKAVRNLANETKDILKLNQESLLTHSESLARFEEEIKTLKGDLEHERASHKKLVASLSASILQLKQKSPDKPEVASLGILQNSSSFNSAIPLGSNSLKDSGETTAINEKPKKQESIRQQKPANSENTPFRGRENILESIENIRPVNQEKLLYSQGPSSWYSNKITMAKSQKASIDTKNPTRLHPSTISVKGWRTKFEPFGEDSL